MYYQGDPAKLIANLRVEYGDEAIEAAIGAWYKAKHDDDPKFVLGPLPPAKAPHYLAYVRQLSCCVCGAEPPNEAHHHGSRGMGQKTDDYRTVPLCFQCHRRFHDTGELPVDFNAKLIDTLVRFLRIAEGT